MTKVKIIVALSILLVSVSLCAGIYVAGYPLLAPITASADEEVAQLSVSGGAPATGVLQVNAIEAKRTNSFERTRSYNAIAKPRRAGDLGFARTGRLKLLVKVGDRVAEGDPLAEIDASRLEAQLMQLKSARVEAKDALDKQIAAAKLSSIEAIRAEIQAMKMELRELRERDDSPDESRIEAAEARVNALDLVSRDPQVVALQSKVRSLDDQIAELQIEIDEHTLVAPYNGEISTIQNNDGVLVAPGVPVLRIVESDAIEVSFALPVAVAAAIEDGATLVARSGGRNFAALLTAKRPELDQTARSRTVLFLIESSDATPLLPGEVVQMDFPQSVNEEGYWLPLTSLTRQAQGQWSVYTLEKEDSGNFVVGRQYVDVLFTQGDLARVRAPLAETSLVISDGTHRVVPGQTVRIRSRTRVENESADSLP